MAPLGGLVALPVFLIDLDMTLLDTSALQAARKQQEWDYVQANLHLARPFVLKPAQPAPHEVPGILRGLGHPVAIVTSSPDWYAKAVLANFGVKYDVLVAYGDTDQHKPHPAPLQEALKRLGVAPSDAYYVGDAEEDFAASYNAGVRSIGAGWNAAVEALYKKAPDICLYHPDLLTRPHLLPQLGYIAEVRMAGLNPLLHHGSILRCGPNTHALGRYYPKKDGRHATDQLTAQILELKDKDNRSAFFGSVLASYVNALQVRPTYATCVPPKPSQTNRIRFAATLAFMQPSVQGVTICPDGMYSLREVEDYKHTAPAARVAAVKDAFASKYTWDNKNVLLLDDVFTSGATSDECARMLAANAASHVQIVCFGVDQDPFVLHTCPYCNRVLKVYHRGYDGKPFWGCPGKFKDGCGYTTSYP